MSSQRVTFNPGPMVRPYYLPALFSSVAASTIAPILPLYAGALGAGVGGAAFVVGMIGLGSLAANVPAGLLVPRLGARRMLPASFAAEALLFLVMAVVPGPYLLAVAAFLSGATHAMARITQLTIFRATVPAEQRGRALALLGGDLRMGFFVGPAVGGVLALVIGYGAVFVTGAVLLAGAAVMSHRWLPRVEGSSGENAGSVGVPGSGGTLLGLLRTHRVVLGTAGTAIITLQVVRYARQVILPLWGASIGINAAGIGTLFSIMYGVELLLFYPAGMIMDHFGRKATAVPAMVILAVGMTLIPLIDSYLLFALVVIVMGAGNGLAAGINMTLSTDFAPRNDAGRFIGIWRMIGDGGVTLGPVLVGAVGAAAGLATAPLLIGGIGLAGAACMLFLVPEPRRRT